MVDIGANDLDSNRALFVSSTPAQQKAVLGKLFPRLAHNWAVTFATLRTACPACEIIAVNQYNPFPTGSLKADLTPVFSIYSSLLQQAAQPFKVRLADVYTPFVGHELTYTWIARGDDHATMAGYAVMADAVAKASSYTAQ